LEGDVGAVVGGGGAELEVDYYELEEAACRGEGGAVLVDGRHDKRGRGC
jgi:hypothetical protein